MSLDAGPVNFDGLITVGDAPTKVFDVVAADGRVDIHLKELLAPLLLLLITLQVVIFKNVCSLKSTDSVVLHHAFKLFDPLAHLYNIIFLRFFPPFAPSL